MIDRTQLTEARRLLIGTPGNAAERVIDEAFDALLDFPTDEQVEAGVVAYEIEFPCICGPEYSERGLVSPHCTHHDGEAVVRAVLEAVRDTMIGDNRD
jgi:hypothetical protein